MNVTLMRPLSINKDHQRAIIHVPPSTTRQMCVHVAAAKGHLEAIQTLVYFGADINAREGLAGWTALHMAAHRGDGRLVRHLMDKCGGVASYVTDYAGRTPGRVAAPSVRVMFADRDDSDSDEYDSDSDSESLFAKIRQSASAIDVA
ncbi:cactus [Danaus plexippus plexippus]|uniref:Cactus n=1 Tax=Danaus plexippus plexippus TaxID=278856 RepID=A0A212F678_DANPL|nr:cactus [Danaus plexippus plexippus]